MGKSGSFDTEKTLQDKRRKNWFWDTNEVFASDLSPFAKLVRLYLARCANSDRQAWPSYNRIAKDCKVSRDTAKRAVAELEEKGWLEKTVQKKQDGEYLSNIYFLCDPPEQVSEKDTLGAQGRCCEHPPCHNLEGVGADSTQVGACSTGVGAETASNNTNITIHSEQEINDHTYIHSYIHHDEEDRARAKPCIAQPVDVIDNVDKVDSFNGEEKSMGEIAIKTILKNAGFEGLPVEVAYISKWFDIFPLGMIEYAVSKSVLNGKKSIPYITGIFEDWIKKGVKTIEQAEKETRYDSVMLRLKNKGVMPNRESELRLPDPQVFRDYQNKRGGG
ncbi:MAG: Replication initiation and membrane attachment [Pelotomaculum sp. PtaB.Bin104]|nr:MAG: Replication initiation and membrane attachment [Pelotomaculum sp. PtaB.Bin104]